jgi:hypothetical protein
VKNTSTLVAELTRALALPAPNSVLSAACTFVCRVAAVVLWVNVTLVLAP